MALQISGAGTQGPVPAPFPPVPEPALPDAPPAAPLPSSPLSSSAPLYSWHPVRPQSAANSHAARAVRCAWADTGLDGAARTGGTRPGYAFPSSGRLIHQVEPTGPCGRVKGRATEKLKAGYRLRTRPSGIATRTPDLPRFASRNRDKRWPPASTWGTRFALPTALIALNAGRPEISRSPDRSLRFRAISPAGGSSSTHAVDAQPAAARAIAAARAAVSLKGFAARIGRIAEANEARAAARIRRAWLRRAGQCGANARVRGKVEVAIGAERTGIRNPGATRPVEVSALRTARGAALFDARETVCAALPLRIATFAFTATRSERSRAQAPERVSSPPTQTKPKAQTMPLSPPHAMPCCGGRPQTPLVHASPSPHCASPRHATPCATRGRHVVGHDPSMSASQTPAPSHSASIRHSPPTATFGTNTLAHGPGETDRFTSHASARSAARQAGSPLGSYRMWPESIADGRW